MTRDNEDYHGSVAPAILRIDKTIMRIALTVMCFALVSLSGCQNERLDKLEKENAEMKAQLEKQHSVGDLELQSKCSRDATAWLREHWNYIADTPKNTITITTGQHYDRKLNQCFAMVESRTHASADPKSDSWIHQINVWDVYENTGHGSFSEVHSIDKDHKDTPVVWTCVVNGTNCGTLDEFRRLINPLMNE